MTSTSPARAPASRGSRGPDARRAPSAWRRLAAIVSPRWIYRDAHYLVADVQLDPEVARRWVPWPLRLAMPARGQLFTAYFPSTTFGSVYREAGVLFEVVHGLARATFCPWMVVDDDVALIAGRDLLGYPKKLGELTWQHAGDHIHATARRRDGDLVTMDARLGAVIERPPPMLGRAQRNVRSAFGLVAFRPRERVVEVRQAELEVAVAGSERDPLHELGLGRVLGGRLHRVDLGAGLPPLPAGPVSPLGYARSLALRSL